MQPPGQIPQIPLIGQQQQQAQRAIQQAIQQLSMGIYAQAASARIPCEVDRRDLRQLAKDSMTAARSYFEGIGAIEQGGNDQ